MSYWAVGASFRQEGGIYDDMSTEFINKNEWYDGYADSGNKKDNQQLMKVNVGDIFFMKSSYTKGKKHSISCTKIKAIGRVMSKFDYYHFEIDWFTVKELPMEFDGVWYSRTIEEMKNEKILYLGKQVLINESEKYKATPDKVLENCLIWRVKPEGGYREIPKIKRGFSGVDIDFEKQAKKQKDLGNKGEELVKEREITYLTECGCVLEASKVAIVMDGNGYDVLSFDENGNEKYIEVKTTTGDEYSPFNLTENEIAFMQANLNKYWIYRLYNYNMANNTGEYFEIGGNVEKQIIMKPTSFKVFLKPD